MRRSGVATGDLRAAARERDLEGRERVFREGARRRPTEVSRVHRRASRPLRGRADLPGPGRVGVRLLPARDRQRSARAVEDERLLARIRESHAATTTPTAPGACGRRSARAGEPVGRGRVERLMRAHGIQGAKRRGKPWRTTARTRRAAGARISSSATSRAAAPNLLWVADVTYLRTWEGWCSSRPSRTPTAAAIVGWSWPSHMRTELVVDALEMAVAPAPPRRHAGLIHHSDQGSQTGFNRSSQHRFGRVSVEVLDCCC